MADNPARYTLGPVTVSFGKGGPNGDPASSLSDLMDEALAKAAARSAALGSQKPFVEPRIVTAPTIMLTFSGDGYKATVVLPMMNVPLFISGDHPTAAEAVFDAVGQWVVHTHQAANKKQAMGEALTGVVGIATGKPDPAPVDQVQQQRNKKLTNEGANANRWGYALAENPYEKGTHDYAMWVIGWKREAAIW